MCSPPLAHRDAKLRCHSSTLPAAAGVPARHPRKQAEPVSCVACEPLGDRDAANEKHMDGI